MASNKSLDENEIIVALLHDLCRSHGDVFNIRSLKLTLNKVNKRLRAEGIGFLTKTLPRLGKHLDRCLTGEILLNAKSVGFETQRASELPKFLGEFFNRIFRPDGTLLSHPCECSVKVLRDVLYLFYKYELPYSDEQEQRVIAKFERTEQELAFYEERLEEIRNLLNKDVTPRGRRSRKDLYTTEEVAREARDLLLELFTDFDPENIHPRHGPGAVATKQKLWDKYLWKNVSRRITDVYPLDAYFYASMNHVCDRYREFNTLGEADLPARVILVPKDSRGPRLISCEPVDFQWVQQGLGRSIVDHVEHHRLTRWNVRFTDQRPNQLAALYGSRVGRYATLDLNEASDRVSCSLVRLLFPDRLLTYLEACRSSSTVLPSGRVLPLKKFAPMGSCLCFPIMALTVWALLTAGTDDTSTRESIYVYGDDVIVPTAYAGRAIELLESFGLKINRDKSCTTGFFRESCGMDAFKGVNVTPVRLRTVWSSTPSPGAYTSWIAYANSFWSAKYYNVYNLIVERLHAVYGRIPSKDMQLACPSLIEVHPDQIPNIVRTNQGLQKRQWRVWDIKSPRIIKHIDGWSMLLRYFAEGTQDSPLEYARGTIEGESSAFALDKPAFDASQYTSRSTSILVRRWR